MELIFSSNHNHNDTVFIHTLELLKMLLLKRCLDNSVKIGDGDTLTLLIKTMLPYFRALGCKKYALAAFEHTAQQQVFLSPKMKAIARQARFVNNLGRADSNLPMDLDVEHSNKFFKENLRLSKGEATAKVLNRLSKSQDKVMVLDSTFVHSFAIQIYSARRKINASKYEQDIEKLKLELRGIDVFSPHPGRRHCSDKLNKTSCDMVNRLDVNDFKDWMMERFSRMKDQQFYKY